MTIDEPHPTRFWGVKGHALIHKEAAEHLPAAMPDFFKGAGERLVGLASQPDRWKIHSLPYLYGSTWPDHYMAYEQVKDKPLPPDRFAMVVAADKAGIHPPQAVGLLPYRVAELYQNLSADFAMWRNQADKTTPTALQAQDNAIYDAGVVGHFVGDASQPLHATIHRDGWLPEVANPHGYRTQPGLHREFENLLINGSVSEHRVGEKIGPPKLIKEDPLQWGLGLVAESNAQVESLYQLEKAGALNPENPAPEGVAFAESRLAKGAENLRDLWYSAWVDSAAVAEQIAHDSPK